MDKTSALNNLQNFLEENSNLKPTEGFILSEPLEQKVDDEVIFYFWWIEQSGRNARGGYSYYVMPDGEVLMPGGGSGHPENVDSIYTRWKSL